MSPENLARISELSRKSRIQSLSAEELEEQAVLRMEYRQAVVGNLKSQLGQITVVDTGEKV
ncbi:MAG: DUF896 domain-containing protein [Ruminococcus sp.]|nr:DUF896 domain-containing protein [Ruminococcus sp.]